MTITALSHVTSFIGDLTDHHDLNTMNKIIHVVKDSEISFSFAEMDELAQSSIFRTSLTTDGIKLPHVIAAMGCAEGFSWYAVNDSAQLDVLTISGDHIGHFSADHGQIASLEWLELYKPDLLDKPNFRGTRPLQHATESRHGKSAAEWLTQRGFKALIVTAKGSTLPGHEPQ